MKTVAAIIMFLPDGLSLALRLVFVICNIIDVGSK